MMRKKLVVAPISNTIYYARVDEKHAIMSSSDRVDVTDDALSAVLTHLSHMSDFEKSGFAGYTYPKRDGSGSVTLCAFRDDEYVCIAKEALQKLRDNQKKP